MVLFVVLTLNVQLYAQPACYPGTALEFDGINDYISGTGINTGLTAVTIEAWIYHNTLPGVVQRYVTISPEVAVLRFDGSALGGYHELHFYIKMANGSFFSLRADNALTTGEWTHIAGTYDGTSMKLYMNGVLVKSANPAGGLFSPDGSFEFSGNSETLDGKIDEVRIWNYVRSSQEIREKMYLTLSGTTTGLLNYWQFNEGTGTTVADVVGAANGTMYNMTGDDWIASTIPFGAGASNTQIVSSTGVVTFTGTDLSMNFTSKTGADTLVVTRIDTVANVEPAGVDEVLDAQYWVMNKFGPGTFSANLTLSLNENLTTEDQLDPYLIKLYFRESNSDEVWTLISLATSVDSANDQATFSNISDFGQFLVCRTALHIDNLPGMALDFDGTDDYVNCGNSARLNITDAITVEAWIKADTWKIPSWEGTIASKDNDDQTGYALRCGDNGRLSFVLGTSEDWHEVLSGQVMKIGEWTHVAGVYDASMMRVYINGKLEGQQPLSASIGVSPQYLLIGESPGYSSRFFDGKIEELRIWNVALTGNQIRENMHLPVFSPETGLISYWQFNNSSGNNLTDQIGVNNGTLVNMDNSDWVNSSIPFGDGVSNSQIENTGIVNFTGTGLTMDFTLHSGAGITVTRIDTVPNMIPTGADYVYKEQYWVINRYGTGTFDADITFTLNKDLTVSDETNPQIFRLYTRGSSADTTWAFLTYASSVNATNNEVTFDEITTSGQFIVCQNPPEISSLELPLKLNLITQDFNSIDAGDFSIPTFTDFDGDGLLDLIIGENTGNIRHYEQESINSTLFTWVTSNFNSIDVISCSAPTITDLDHDGLLDLIIGNYHGNLSHYEQNNINSASFTLVTSNFNSIDVGDNSTPTFTDLDGDGLLDLIIGEYNGNLNHYEQDGIHSTSFTFKTTTFNSINIGLQSASTFTDLDGDGLLDLIIGEVDGNLNHYEQNAINSSNFSLITANFNSINVGNYSTPTFTELDGDGLLDMIIGKFYGHLDYYKQVTVDSIDFATLLPGSFCQKNYLIKAENLLDDLNIDCPEGFKISLLANTGFSQTLSLSPAAGKISDTVFVRFETNSIGEYSGNIVHTSLGAELKYIAVHGICSETVEFPGTALNFDGSNDYVEIPDDPGLDLTVNYTIEAWIKPESFSGLDGIVSKYQSADANGYDLRLTNVSPYSGLDFDGMRTPTGVLSVGQWYHVAAVNENGTRRIYINGVQQSLTGTPRTVVINNNPLCIGVDYLVSGRYFDGNIEEVRLWNTARNTVQIRENMYLPLSGSESGLVSYWQFNDENGTTLSDLVGGYHGTLKNMDETDWVGSYIPFGPGFSTSGTEIAGEVDFTGTGLSMDFNAQNGAEITVTRIDTIPNMIPVGPDSVFSNQYWVVNRYGTGTFDASMTFTLNEDLIQSYETSPSLLKLYLRPSNSDAGWTYIKTSASVNAINHEVTFSGITTSGQFIICRNLPEIIPMELPLHLNLITQNFSSINSGNFLAPAFTNLDGDGLLDLIIGKEDGTLNYYEQDNIHSTSFSLITANFNSIDVVAYSTPTFTDLDGDGLLDMIIGNTGGNLYHYEQNSINSTSFSLKTSSFNSIDVGTHAAPAFTDLDGDNLLDLLIGDDNGTIYQYEQTTVNSTIFSLITSGFNSINVGGSSKPIFTDLDGDGLLDLIIGEYDGNLNHYEQNNINSTSFTLVTSNYNSIDVGGFSTPTFSDPDGDGLLDLIAGEWNNFLNHYEQKTVESLNFGVLPGSWSQKQYFMKAENLLADLNIDCPEGFKISLSANSGFSQILTISPSAGRISDTVFVRFEPDSIGEYGGNIVHTSFGSVSKNIAVNGICSEIDKFPGMALNFDGYEDYVDCGYGGNLNITGSITIEAWIKADTWKANVWEGTIAGKDDWDQTGYNLRCGDNGRLSFTIGSNGEWPEAVSGNVMHAGEWAHVAGVYDGSEMRVYINGKPEGQFTHSGSIDSPWQPLYIGDSPGFPDRLFDGKIEEVRLWNVARTEAQIRENMNLPISELEPGLVSYWQFNDSSGTTLTDVTGGNSGNLVNMDNSNWVTSSIPFGAGAVNTQIVSTTGTVNFTGTSLAMNFISKSGIDTLVVSRIDTVANIQPFGVDSVLKAQYWVVGKYGTGTFETDMTFTVAEDLTQYDEAHPSSIRLFTRGSTADTNWRLLDSAVTVNAATNQATFNGITGFSQFIVARGNVTAITWTGSLSTDWNTAGNWSSNVVPTDSDNVIVPDVTNDPIVNEDPGTPAVCYGLTIETGAVLTIAAGKALIVNGTPR